MGNPRLWNAIDEENFRIKERRSKLNEKQYVVKCENLQLARQVNRKTKNSRRRYWEIRYLVLYDSDDRILLAKELKKKRY